MLFFGNILQYFFAVPSRRLTRFRLFAAESVSNALRGRFIELISFLS